MQEFSNSRTSRGRTGRRIVLALFGLLVLILFNLQIINHAEYRATANTNRLVKMPLRAPRGLILDRDGNKLADNLYLADITMPAAVLEDDSLLAGVTRLMDFWGMERAAALERLQQQRARGRQRLVLAPNASTSMIQIVAEYARQLPDIRIETRAWRRYAYGPLFAHVVGYLGEVRPDEIGVGDHEYKTGDVIGRLGIEHACEDRLRGRAGWEIVEVDAARNTVRRREDWRPGEEVLPAVEPVPGQDIVVTLAVALQESLRAALAGGVGCGVALSLPSGEVLASYSSPSFDPNLLTASLSPQTWESLAGDPRKPFFNRVVQATYPPGSLFKPISSLCALQHGVVGTETVLEPCYGAYRFGNRIFHCWRRSGHGSLTHIEALVNSCDIYYYQLAQGLEVDQLAAAARTCGLGRACGTIFGDEAAGHVPTAAWYDRRYPQGWSRGVMLNNIIGQGELLVTPLQIVALAGRIATSGRMGRPHFLRDDRASEQSPAWPFPEAHLRWVRKALAQVVDVGTGGAARLAGVPVAGKTGTSQNPHGDDHAWFMAYAPTDSPEVAIAVILENAGHGGAVAAPVAGRWLRAYFAWAAERGTS
jgi:penicillin-binding protein 2